MIKRFLISGGFCAALAGCIVPEGTNEADLTNFDDALASIGCDLLFESDYLPMEFQTGLTREQIQGIAAAKVRRGQAVALENGGIRSTVGACATAKAG